MAFDDLTVEQQTEVFALALLSQEIGWGETAEPGDDLVFIPGNPRTVKDYRRLLAAVTRHAARLLKRECTELMLRDEQRRLTAHFEYDASLKRKARKARKPKGA